MTYKVGQAVLAKVRFKDGDMPKYSRPYLIVGVGDNYIDVINVSSSEGKESKLQKKSNKALFQYSPPFIKPSFVKLDSLVRINPKNEQLKLLCGGKTLNTKELSEILELIKLFN